MTDSATPHDDIDLDRKVAGLPTKPGVYQHKDSSGKVIYVGKAKNLRSRVRSYFQDAQPVNAKTRALMNKIADVEVIVTDTEAEALILENTLIKRFMPRYNVLLRDDKSYPYIRVTKEQFPRIFKTRRVIRDGSKYFGPYTDGTYLYFLLKTLRSIFPLRSCDLPLSEKNITEGRYKVCLDYHIKKCEGPCEGLVDMDHYNVHIKQAQQVLNGRTSGLEKQLETLMMGLADKLRFEDAAIIRQRLQKLREYTFKQKVVADGDADRDVFALARIGPTACTLVFTIRDGKLIGKRHYYIRDCADRSDEELIRSTLDNWYVENEFIPDEVIVPVELDPDAMTESFLREKRGRAFELIVPKIGDKKKLLAMAETNADFLLRELILQQEQKDQTVPRAVLSLQRDLQMTSMPRRIECFDNSHMQGTDYVSSMVVFVDGKPKKSEYRKYKLRDVVSNDDFEAMKEVMRRRYAPLAEAAGEELPKGVSAAPDLVVIDGGKGQLSHAMEIFRELELEGAFTVVGLAKRLEEVFLPGDSDPIILPKTSSSLRLLQQARDEAHRFAITYHRKLRDKRTLSTELTSIAGVGDKTAQKLLQTFGSVENIKSLSFDQLTDIVGASIAQKIIDHYKQ